MSRNEKRSNYFEVPENIKKKKKEMYTKEILKLCNIKKKKKKKEKNICIILLRYRMGKIVKNGNEEGERNKNLPLTGL